MIERVAVPTVEENADQFLRPYDIVPIIKGSVGKVGIVPNDVPEPRHGDRVAGQSAIVLSAGQDLLAPRAIAVQLRSETGQNVLKLATTGATIQLNPLKMLMQMPVFSRTRRPWRPPFKSWKKSPTTGARAPGNRHINPYAAAQVQVA